MKTVILTLFILFVSPSAFSAWIETSGTVERINFYTHTGTVIVKLNVSGEVVEECTNTIEFAIHESVPEDRRDQIVSALLAAQATKNTVGVAYRNIGGCVEYDGNQNAYRGITRVRILGST